MKKTKDLKRFYWKIKNVTEIPQMEFTIGFASTTFKGAEQQMLLRCKLYNWVPIEYQGWDEIDDQK